MNISKFYWWVVGVGCTVFTLIAIAVHHLNSTNSDGSWLGLGTLVLLGVILSFLGLVALIFWLSIRNAFRKGKNTPQPIATTPKKWTAWRLIKWVLTVGLISGACSTIGTRLINPPPPQPQGRCDDSFDQDDLGIYNFSQSPKDRVVVNPGSTTKLCYGSLVSIPEDRWKTWGAQFVKPAGQKERCVAYFSYIYPDQHVITLGPRYEQELGIGNVSGTWRVATNCPIEYYRW